jgi:lipopolysaccharide assembly protein A
VRYVHMILIAVFVLIVATFALQNLAPVTMSFLAFDLTAPLAAVVGLVYVLGMISGGSVVSSVRHSLHAATSRAARKGPPPA